VCEFDFITILNGSIWFFISKNDGFDFIIIVLYLDESLCEFDFIKIIITITISLARLVSSYDPQNPSLI
jgi:hypothetical protein